MSIIAKPAAISAPTEQQREFHADKSELRRMSADATAHPGLPERQWGFAARLDPSVTFEEFTYWAKVERELEDIEYKQYRATTTHRGFMGTFKGYFTSNAYEDTKAHADPSALASHDKVLEHTDITEKAGTGSDSDDAFVAPIGPQSANSDLNADWRKASRALRTAGWGTVFYLITTDILGWGQCAYVFANTGYGYGFGIFVLMGIAAFLSGIYIWQTFLKLDSSRYPMVTFGDAFFRLFGKQTRNFINVLQSLQMFLSVAIVLIGQTLIIAQLGVSSNLCYVVATVIALVVSMASGYMRSLKHLGWFCNAAVWFNVVSFILCCISAGLYFPNAVAQVYNSILPKEWAVHPVPVATFVGTPPALYQPTSTNLFAAKFNGINSMVYAYSGAILFVAFLSEMRHPWDFWKGMLCAQLFISVSYIFFGGFVYSQWGQYAFSNINQSVAPLGLQIVVNVLSLLTGWLAIFLYFNVGMKTVYIEVFQEIFKLPAITTPKGRKLWWGLGPIYWILAFIVCLSIPAFSAFVNFVGGLLSLNFTYSFSGIMYVAYLTQDGARLEGEGFDPITGVTTRHDGGIKRLMRGYFKNAKLTIPVTIYFLAGLAASGMGTWAATLGLIAALGPGGIVATSWNCTNPFYVTAQAVAAAGGHGS
ncbi:transmembrane amino acid transporter protein-domain-containing protein [Neohortaea acidophila]|uniref:Transmembrane amino acid transporter protein-domain-containing protein n=1 Tax=Neohortaea acidophila TaxID=245834 RepID=A0A6A6Q027_9PEZI|nr:transmembrane amino acid transporter protein-domain-containing protein [Neohortaea acidophila]KAF2484777.1 transmembrane amino acid transporter protein-domain-containing protein [Neohortaea acidophila]